MTFSKRATRWVKDIRQKDVSRTKSMYASSHKRAETASLKAVCARKCRLNWPLARMEYARAAPDLIATLRSSGAYSYTQTGINRIASLYVQGKGVL